MPWTPYYSGDPAELFDVFAEILAAAQRPWWHKHAACRGLDTQAWFPVRGAIRNEVRTVCAACAVRSECLTFALEHDAEGVWAGTSKSDRRAMRRHAA
jgi:WhiB family redox-sensing transcriptional regulator